MMGSEPAKSPRMRLRASTRPVKSTNMMSSAETFISMPKAATRPAVGVSRFAGRPRPESPTGSNSSTKPRPIRSSTKREIVARVIPVDDEMAARVISPGLARILRSTNDRFDALRLVALIPCVSRSPCAASKHVFPFPDEVGAAA